MESASRATAEPDEAPEFTAGSLDSAAAVLRRATGDTDPAPAPILSLTDEQLVGMAGDRSDQLTALPWLAEHAGDGQDVGRREFAAGIGLRSLVASGQVRIVTDSPGQGTGTGSRWEAAPELDGCLVLRRTATAVTSLERTMNTAAGPQVNRLYCYVHPSGVLEEEVTASGIHRFTPLRPGQARERIAAMVDPAGVSGGSAPSAGTTASAAGDGQEPAAEDIARRLAGTLAMSVITVVRTGGDGVRQLSLAATDQELLRIDGAGDQLHLTALDAEALRALSAGLIALDG